VLIEPLGLIKCDLRQLLGPRCEEGPWSIVNTCVLGLSMCLVSVICAGCI